MKQNLRLLLLTLLCAVCMGTWGTEVTFTAGTDKGTHTGSNNDAGEDAVTKNGVTISTTNGAFGAAQYRVYKDATFKVSSTVGKITKVVITCPVASNGNYSSKFFTGTGNGYSASDDGTTGTWTGDATEFSLTASAQVRMTKVVVTIGESESVNPAITLDSYAITVSADGDTKTLNVTYSNFTPEDENIDLVFYATADGATTANCDWITFSIEDGAIELEFDANTGEERKAYFKVYSLDDDDNDVYSDLVTLTQEAYKEPAAEFAELPFEFDDGKADIEGTDGLTQNGLGGDYGSSPKLKFDDTNDWLLLKFNERPGKLTFDIKGNSFSNGTFKVQTSEDGETFKDLAVYTELGSSTQSKEFSNIGENVRYIKWIYTEKVNGNVALGNITLDEYKQPESYTLTITSNDNAEIFVFYNDPENNYPNIESGDQVLATSEVLVSVSASEGYQIESVTVTKEDGQDVTLTEHEDGISWTFTMPSSKVTVACIVSEIPEPSDEEWVLTSLTDLTEDDIFVIVGNNGRNYAMTNDISSQNPPSAVAVTISDKKITSTVADNIKWNISGNATNGYTFYPNGDDKNWLYTTNTNNGVRIGTNNNKIFTLSDNYLKNTATDRYVGIYNSQDWRCYTSFTGNSNIANQTFAFYKLVKPEAIIVDITSVGYATLYYGDKTLIVPEGVVAKMFVLVAKPSSSDDPAPMMNSKRAEESTTIEEVDIAAGDYIPAGTGVVLEAITKSEETQTFEFAIATLSEPLEADASNILYGSDEPTMTDEIVEGDNLYYLLSTDKNGENVGFYWGAKNGVAFENGAHKAFLAIPKSSGVNASSFVFDELTGIHAITSDSTESAEGVYTLSGMRIDGKQLPKGIYIVNGKKMVIK